MLKKTILAVAVASLAGCSVTHYGTEKRADEVKTEISSQAEKQQKKRQEAQRPLYKRIAGNYVGRTSAPVAMNTSLPPTINDISFSLPRRTNLATAAKNISKMTNYPVRINPDVYVSPRQIVPQIEAMPQQNGKEPAMPSNLMSAQLSDFDTSLPTDFNGPLKEYLDNICGALNINWEFDPIKGFYFYRLVTKIFEAKMNIGDNKVSTSAGKGANATTGSNSTSVGASGQNTGSFTSKTTASSDANYNSWAALESSLHAIRTPLGRIAIDVSTNSVLVRDTREVVDLAEHIITRGNQVHSRIISLEVRILRVSYDDSSAAGLSAQAAYKQLLSNGTPNFNLTLQSPGSLVAADSGSLGFNVLSALSPWKDSTGLIQALNQAGTVVSDTTEVYVTMNRRTQSVASFDTEAYLAETTPASGGGGLSGAGGAGVPGLKPATLTTGSFLSLTPTAYDDGNIWLDMSLDQSEKKGENDKATTGSGETFQQIQLPKTRNDSKVSNIGIKPGESMILVNMKRDSMSHTNRTGILGASGSGQHTREMQVIIVTPTVRSI